jgi:hypothetical protein
MGTQRGPSAVKGTIAVVSCVSAAIDNVYYAVLDNPTKGLNAVNLHTLVMHILNTYAQIS